MRVYVLEDEENIRNYILSILKEIPEIVVVGYADQVQTALVEIPKLEPSFNFGRYPVKRYYKLPVIRYT